METTKVWVKLRNSTNDSFRVEIKNADGAIIDDLKDAIKAKKNVEVQFIYLEDGQEENSTCSPADRILSHNQVGKSIEHPYFFTIKPPPASGRDTMTLLGCETMN